MIALVLLLAAQADANVDLRAVDSATTSKHGRFQTLSEAQLEKMDKDFARVLAKAEHLKIDLNVCRAEVNDVSEARDESRREIEQLRLNLLAGPPPAPTKDDVDGWVWPLVSVGVGVASAVATVIVLCVGPLSCAL